MTGNTPRLVVIVCTRGGGVNGTVAWFECWRISDSAGDTITDAAGGAGFFVSGCVVSSAKLTVLAACLVGAGTAVVANAVDFF